VQVKVVLEPLPEFDHRSTGGNPEFAAKPDKVVFAVGTENLRVWGSVRLRHKAVRVLTKGDERMDT
jgi:hypothetical protein